MDVSEVTRQINSLLKRLEFEEHLTVIDVTLINDGTQIPGDHVKLRRSVKISCEYASWDLDRENAD